MHPADRDTFQHCVISRRPDGSLWELGRGAMGVTYRALDSNLHAPVALKVIAAALLPDAKARARFLREARSAAQLRHTNVATVYHLGQEDDCVFYTMEWIDGETTEALVRRGGPLDAVAALRIVQQTARALQAAHARSLLHRDLKPSNLMVLHEGGDLLVKVIDFGLVKPLEGSDDPADSGASLSGGLFIGTPMYASPELCTQSEKLDGRADLYSLGATLWYLLTGDPPFKGSARSVIAQQITKAPPMEALRGQPREVADLLAALLAKDPSQRPPDAAAVRQQVGDILARLEGGATVPPPPPTPAGTTALTISLKALAARRSTRLTRPETRLLLFPLAALADNALLENRRLDLAPSAVNVRLLEPPATSLPWEDASIVTWPRFVLETRDLPPPLPAVKPVDPLARALDEVVAILRGLLGDGSPAALAFLPPEAARVVAAVSTPAPMPPYPSVSAFAIAFIAAWHRGAPEESAHQSSAPIFAPSSTDSEAAETLLEGRPSAPAPALATGAQKRKFGCLPLLLAVGLVVLAAASHGRSADSALPAPGAVVPCGAAPHDVHPSPFCHHWLWPDRP